MHSFKHSNFLNLFCQAWDRASSQLLQSWGARQIHILWSPGVSGAPLLPNKYKVGYDSESGQKLNSLGVKVRKQHFCVETTFTKTTHPFLPWNNNLATQSSIGGYLGLYLGVSLLQVIRLRMFLQFVLCIQPSLFSWKTFWCILLLPSQHWQKGPNKRPFKAVY